MPRAWRFYTKKRGSRRIGSSDVAGSWGLCALSAASLVIGLAALAYFLFALTIPELRANHAFVEGKGIIRDKRLNEKIENDGKLYDFTKVYRPEFKIRYQAFGNEYEHWVPYDPAGLYASDPAEAQAILAQYHVNGEYPIWIDPHNPNTAVISKSYTLFAWLLLLLPAPFIGFGIAGLTIYSLRGWQSVERRAALRRRLASRELLAPADRGLSRFPTVPAESDTTNSPGTRLAYRLPGLGESLPVLSLLLGCIVWNGLALICALTLITAITTHPGALRDSAFAMTVWGAVTVVFLLVGCWLIYLFVRRIMIGATVGPTYIEISTHPLRPGAECEGFLSQSGRIKIKSLSVKLVCDEEATYRQGTDSRTERQRVFESTLLERSDIEATDAEPWESSFAIRIPDRVMHSFESDHNKILWRILVAGRLLKWPDFERSYRILVFPAREGV